MPEISLIAEPRSDHGSGASRRLRSHGRIPAVVYGHGVDPISVSVDARDLRSALSSSAGANALFDLRVGSDRHLAIARSFQRHPVRQSVAHIDFQVVRRDEVVPAEVPLHLVGEPLAVNRAGGNVEQLVQNLHIKAKPADIPVAFELDISELEIGDSIRASAIVVPEGVVLEVDLEAAVVVAHAPRAATSEEPTAEEAAAAPAGEQASESSSEG